MFYLFVVGEELKVIYKAGEIGNHAAGYKYDIPESCIRD